MRLTYSLLAISLILNLYLIVFSLPARTELVQFWKSQTTVWRERYFELLNSYDELQKTLFPELRGMFPRDPNRSRTGKDSKSGKG